MLGAIPSFPNSARAMPRPSASSTPANPWPRRNDGAARGMSNMKPLASWFFGPHSPLGLTVAAVTLLIDQAHKAWMLYVYDIGAKGTVTLAPFFDLVLVWNRGVSYGLFPQE